MSTPIFLSYFESEIISLLSAHYTKEEVAEKFQLCETALEKHLEKIISKIDIVQSSDYYLDILDND